MSLHLYYMAIIYYIDLSKENKYLGGPFSCPRAWALLRHEAVFAVFSIWVLR
jgi:hypothetical protein